MQRPSRFLLPAAVAGLLLAVSVLSAQESPEAGEAADHPSPVKGGVEMSPAMKQVTTKVLCPCGTCVNQTLYECICGTAVVERDKIAAALEGGMTAEEIIEGYVREYGLQVLSAPDKTGFNLFGWMVPFIVATAALAALTLVLRRWIRSGGPAGAGVSAAAAGAAPDDPYRERLERELKELDY